MYPQDHDTQAADEGEKANCTTGPDGQLFSGETRRWVEWVEKDQRKPIINKGQTLRFTVLFSLIFLRSLSGKKKPCRFVFSQFLCLGVGRGKTGGPWGVIEQQGFVGFATLARRYFGDVRQQKRRGG